MSSTFLPELKTSIHHLQNIHTIRNSISARPITLIGGNNGISKAIAPDERALEGAVRLFISCPARELRRQLSPAHRGNAESTFRLRKERALAPFSGSPSLRFGYGASSNRAFRGWRTKVDNEHTAAHFTAVEISLENAILPMYPRRTR